MSLFLSKTIYHLKWLLLTVFLFGHLITYRYFDMARYEFLFFNLIALIALTIILKSVERFDPQHTATWLALLLFIMGYFVRFYWITIDPLPVERMLPSDPFHIMIKNRDALLTAFELSVIAFASFCGSVAIFLKLQKRNVLRLPIQSEDETVEVKQIFGRALLTLTAFAAVMLAYISFQYKIGEMGSPSGTALPFRIKGLIFYARIICVPLILLFSIYLLDRSDDFRWSRVGIMILLLNGIVDMFLRNSRSSLLLALLLIGFLIFVNGVRLRHKEKVFLGAVALFALFMVPIMTEYRHMRTALKLSQFNAILAVFEHTGGNWIQQLADAIKFVLFRMPGIESLWCQLALGARPLGLHSFEIIRSTNGIAGYLTFAIHPMKLGDNTLLAPGFVGWLYMVGGAPIIILGSSIIGFITVYIWKLLAVIFTNSYVIAKVFLLWMLFIALTEGTLDSMGLMITAGITTIIFVEVLVRRLFRIVVI